MEAEGRGGRNRTRGPSLVERYARFAPKVARKRPFSELNFEHRICPIEGELPAGIVRELAIDRAEWYRARAAECEAMAFCTPDPHARALLEEMAATWRTLADRVERWQLQ
jgi:hypothetical protein